ncbi:hypothetical protein [Pseudomonas phenolilytica]|uniref:hypothetical protein n=2 Tax=Pseudomonas TaxID=286 RepID=UPI00051D14CD|nr:hypothetical protein [Pseudomonas phenolilytica]KGK81343.1 hypothetical protein DP64_17075 [Stutzerimonas degradans]MCQ4267646.1 hypothetical protein [Stutzerimonas degradans]UIP85028.1 hypothetical protein HU825_00210 [Pseudomonas phenolilytica]
MSRNDDQPNEEPDVTMTNAGEKNPGEDPDFDDKPSPPIEDDREPEVLPDDPDILGNDGSSGPGA